MDINIYIHISKNRGGGEIYILPPYICSGVAASPLPPLFRRPYL